MTSKIDAKIISELFYLLDTNTRNDLYHNSIADERDYVSRLVACFNYPFGIFNQYILNRIKLQSKWFAKVNSGHNERKFGCDSMIVFRVNNRIKVGLFEAKWPRVIKDPNYQWDYTQKSNKKSHFSDQIRRQSRWTNQAAIWEMFFYEEKVGTLKKPFDKNASTCVRHSFANSFIHSNPSLQTIWDNNDLTTLIQSEQSPSFDGTNETNIRKIIFDILTCNFGDPIKIDQSDRSFILKSIDDKEIVKCPIISLSNGNDTNEIIEKFMAENGLSFFQQLNIESLNELKE